MDALVNYGSDDESSDKCQENKVPKNEEMKTSGRSLNDPVEDVNYDNVQMDMSEESDAGQRPKAGRSSSSCPSSSSEAEEEALHVKPCVPSGLSSQDTKRVIREKDAGSSRHRRREESRRSPGHKEKQKKKDRSGRRSRSKDRSEKSKESKERRRRESSRERGGTYDGESKESYRKDCRSRSRERSRYRHHSERRRSRSRSPHHHHHRHHHRHNDDERRSKRSRGRSSSRNRTPDGGRTAEVKKANAVSRAVAAAAANINAAVAATEAASKNESNSELEEDGSYPPSSKAGQQATSVEGVSNQNESSSTPKAAMGLAASLLSPQLLVQRSLEVHAAHLHNATGIQFPAYYNPAAMNPLKYAEQMQKRKKLWSGNKDTSKETGNTGPSGSTNNWESTTFAQDQDGKLSAKFKRLMGIKTPGAVAAQAPAGQPASTSQPSEDVIKKQEELFSTMERQYEAARLATHTLRGVGLGFGSSSAYQYPR